MSSPPNDRGGALHVLGDAISAAVTGVAGTLGRSVGSVVVAANKATETVTHVLPGAGTGLTADEYVHQAPDKHAPQPHQGTLKQIEAQTLQELHADKARQRLCVVKSSKRYCGVCRQAWRLHMRRI